MDARTERNLCEIKDYIDKEFPRLRGKAPSPQATKAALAVLCLTSTKQEAKKLALTLYGSKWVNAHLDNWLYDGRILLKKYAPVVLTRHQADRLKLSIHGARGGKL